MSSTFAFPRIDVPKKDKDEDYHRQAGLAIINETIDATYDINYAQMDESVTFFNGDQGGEEFAFMQSAEDGEVLPATWINFNRIRSKLEVLFGELQTRSHRIDATSINKDAKARKLKAKEKARVNMKLAPAREALEQQVGLPLTPQGIVPKDEEELDSFFKYNFKEKNEIIMEYALRWLAKKHRWSYTRLAAYRHLMIMGKSFYMVEMKDGLPFIRIVDPRFVVYDSNATDDFLSDSTYFGEIRYMSLADAASKFKMDEKEIEEVYGRYQNQKRSPGSSQSYTGNTSYSGAFGGLHESNLQYFRGSGSDLRVLVFSTMWHDIETIQHRETTDNYGGEHLKEVSDTAISGKLITNTIAQWRKATIIGGDLVKDWGVIENSVRDNDNLAETSCPMKALIPNFFNGRAVSKVDQVKGLQKTKDLALYNLQLEMNTAGRKGFIYDVSQIPDGWDVHTMMKVLKTAGIAFIDSKKDGLPSTHNQFQTIDQTISESVNHYMAISDLMDRQMDAITGINDARQGQIQGAAQAVGVTQAALMQSNMATKMYEDLFRQHNEAALNHQAGLVKLTFAGNEQYAPIIGDVGVNFLEETVDLELDDFGIFIEEVPPLLDDVNSFREIVQAALHSGAIGFTTAARLMSEKDVLRGIDKLEAKEEENKKRQQEMEDARNKAIATGDQTRVQAEQQGKESIIGLTGQENYRRQELVNKGEIDQIVTKGRIDAGSQGVDVSKDMKLATLKANVEARKTTSTSK